MTQGMLIGDAEIRETCDGFGLDADAVIASLNANPKTQADKATRPPGTRYRPDVAKMIQQLRG